MRGRGGYIGFNRVPAASAANSAASGVWTVREAEALKRAGTWPFYQDTVSFLAPFDTSIADASRFAAPLTVNGSVSINTSVKKYGAGSAQFSGGDITASSDSRLAYTGNFTIEGWFYFTQNNVGYQPLMATTSGSDATGWILLIENNDTLTFYGSNNVNWIPSLSRSSSYVPPVNQWVHIAVVRNGTSMNVYADGSVVSNAGQAASSGTILGGNTFSIGGYLSLPKFSGYMDDLRISNGFAVYTSGFTPPNAH